MKRPTSPQVSWRLGAATCALFLLTACAGNNADTPSAAPSTAPPTAPATPTAAVSAGASEDAQGTENFGPNVVSFISKEHGWALSPGSCRRCGNLATTVDAGRQWTPVAHDLRLPGNAQELVSGRIGMYFADSRHGYLYAQDRCRTCFLTTSDGGHSWQPAALPAIAQLVSSDDTTAGGRSATLYALAVAGRPDQRALFRSTRGAGAWTRLRLPTTSPAAFVAAQGGTVAVLARGDYAHHGRLWVSTDLGDTWTARPVPCRSTGSGAALLSLALGNPSAMLIDCYNNEQSQQAQFTQHHLYGSTDSGHRWIRLGDPPQTGAPTALADNGAGHAFLATEAGGGNLLATTGDGGRHWRRGVANHAGFFGWSDLRFVSPTTGFVLGPTHGAPERLYRTLDGGRTWHSLPLPPSRFSASVAPGDLPTEFDCTTQVQRQWDASANGGGVTSSLSAATEVLHGETPVLAKRGPDQVTYSAVTDGRLIARVVVDRLADGTWRATSESRCAADQ